MNLPPVLRQRYLDSDGHPLAGGKLYTYQAGTSTPQATYTDSSGSTPNANPVVLDADGEADVWLNPEWSYKFVLKDSGGVTQWVTDNVIGLLTNNAVVSASIQDGAVTTPKLAAGAVTGTKLASSASTDLDRPVNSDHIRDGAITGAKLNSAIVDGISIEKASNVVQVKDSGISTAKIANGAVTQAKRAAMSVPSSAANATIGYGTYGTSLVTIGSVSITSTGRPVVVTLVPDGAGTAAIQVNGSSSANASAVFQITRDGTVIYTSKLGSFPAGSTSANAWFPPGVISMVDSGASAAAHTYTLSAQWDGSSISGALVSTTHCNLIAYEL